ncbi:hypothetical protein LTR70_005732, partial [Exophiala xenobiotica]
MQAMDVAAPNDPPGYVCLSRFLPASIVVSTFANFFTLLIAVGAHGAARRFWNTFDIFISLAWLFFLIALTLSILAQMVITYQRHHVLDAFGRGRDGYRKWRDSGMGSKTWGERTAVGLVVKVPLAMVIAFIMLLGFMFCSLCV